VTAVAARTVVEIPYEPRRLQRVVHRAMEQHRFGAMVCHRRFGKTVLAVNHLIKGALTCRRERPRFAYIGPTYRQAKATAWDYLKFYARAIPGMVANESELRVDFPNEGQVRIYGGDNPDSLRGLYLDGVVPDEYGLHQSDLFSTVLRPALSDREGWALFLGTPNGKNQFYEVLQHAQATADWFYAVYKASETGLISDAELAEARKVMTSDEYAQEFECSFEAAVKGAIYSKELEAARSQQRIVRVPVDPVLPVDTVWDLGVGDATAIWFAQRVRGGEARIVDYYEASGEGLPFYAAMLRAKGYTYGEHWAPHDIQVREFTGDGRSRLEVARSLGITFRVVPKVSVEDRIHAARMLLPLCVFDAERCKEGLEALQHYRRDYNQRLDEFKATPVHDWASHGADAFGYLALAFKAPKPTAQPVDDYRPRSSWG
jgi:phage terminase large subunit